MMRRELLHPQSEVFPFIKWDGPFYPGYGPRLFASRQPPFHNKWPRILPAFRAPHWSLRAPNRPRLWSHGSFAGGWPKAVGLRSPHVFPVRNRL